MLNKVQLIGFTGAGVAIRAHRRKGALAIA